MSVFVSHEPQDTLASAFGPTIGTAEAEAMELDNRLKDEGNFTHVDYFGSKLRPDLYGWNVMYKKIKYS